MVRVHGDVPAFLIFSARNTEGTTVGAVDALIWAFLVAFVALWCPFIGHDCPKAWTSLGPERMVVFFGLGPKAP